MNVEEMINMLTPVGPGFQGPEEAKVWFDGYVTLHPNDAYEVIAKLRAAEELYKAWMEGHITMHKAAEQYERAGTEDKG